MAAAPNEADRVNVTGPGCIRILTQQDRVFARRNPPAEFQALWPSRRSSPGCRGFAQIPEKISTAPIGSATDSIHGEKRVPPLTNPTPRISRYIGSIAMLQSVQFIRKAQMPNAATMQHYHLRRSPRVRRTFASAMTMMHGEANMRARNTYCPTGLSVSVKSFAASCSNVATWT